MNKKSKTKNLTMGKPWKIILFFALPLLGSSLIQQMYSTVDLIFVGRYLGTEAAAAVGSSDLLVTCLIGLFTGISVGSSVIAAQAFGSGDRKRLHRLIQSVFFFGMIGAAVLLMLGLLLAPAFLKLLHTPEDVFPLAVTYLRIYFFSMFSIVLYNLGSGIVRALGDSAAAMRFQIIGGVANVVADFLFIAVLDWGVAGAALATLLSQTAAALMTIRYLQKLEEDIALKPGKPEIDKRIIRNVLQIGIPSGIQSMIISFSNLFIQSIINGFGVDTMAAFAAYFKVELFIYYPIVAFGQALVTYTAQNMGAGRLDRIKSGIVTTLLMGIGTVLLISLGLLAVIHPVFGLFNSDPAVIADGARIASVTFPLYFLYVLQECFGSATKGMGKALSPMVIIVLTMCILRIAALEITTSVQHELEAVAVVYPITWLCASVLMGINFLHVWRKMKIKLQ